MMIYHIIDIFVHQKVYCSYPSGIVWKNRVVLHVWTIYADLVY